MSRMKPLLNVYHTLKNYRNLKGEAIHSLSIGERKVLAELVKGGYIYG